MSYQPGDIAGDDTTYTFFVGGNPLPYERARADVWAAQIRSLYAGPLFPARVTLQLYFRRKNYQPADINGLVRAVTAALSDVAWRDDSMVSEVYARKEVDPAQPGVTVVISAVMGEGV